MAAPHVSGVAALIYAAAPAATVAEVRSALLGGTDPIDSLVGKAVTGGRLNASGALRLVIPSEEPSPSPSATASASPSPSASPSASPSGSPTVLPIDLDHEREVRLRLRGHVRMRGRVLVPDDVAACLANVTIKIKRNGRVVKTLTTDDAGLFSVKLRDRAGRYVAKAPAVDLPAGRCVGAASPMRRHTH